MKKDNFLVVKLSWGLADSTLKNPSIIKTDTLILSYEILQTLGGGRNTFRCLESLVAFMIPK